MKDREQGTKIQALGRKKTGAVLGKSEMNVMRHKRYKTCSVSFLMFFLLAISLSGLCGVPDMEKSLLFYEPCDSLRSACPAVSISAQLVPEGKYGSCLRIERRTVNALDNGDFRKQNSDSWICGENVMVQSSGGMDNGPCMQIKTGDVAIPVSDIKPGVPNALSFYVQKDSSSPISTLRITWESGGKVATLKELEPNGEWSRVTVSLVSASDSGTVRISVQGTLKICMAQLDKGAGFFNSFSSPHVMRGVDGISLPLDKGYFNPERGAFSCWMKADWIDSNSTGETCTVFGVNNIPEQKGNWREETILGLSCNAGVYSAYMLDSKTRFVGLAYNRREVVPDPKHEWHFIVFNWELKDEVLSTSLYFDGGKAKIFTEKPFGPVKKSSEILIGRRSGSYFNGFLDDCAIFDQPLSEDDVNLIYNSNKPISYIIKTKGEATSK